MTMGHFSNNTDRGKRNHCENSLSTTNPKHNGQGLKLSLHGAWPVIIRLSMALKTTRRSKITFLPIGPNFENSILLRSPAFALLAFW
jgi:hypothetical protein